MASSIKKNLFYNTALKILNVLFPLITAPYVARVLGAEGLGIAGFSMAYASYFALFAALGIPMYGIREIAKCRDSHQESKSLISEIFSIHIYSALLFIVIYVLTIYQIPQLAEQKNFLLVAGLLLYVSPFDVEWFFSGREEFKFITIRSIVVKTIGLMGLFIFVKTKDDLVNYIIVLVFSSVVNQIWNYIVLYKIKLLPYLTFKNLKRHLKPLIFFYASAVAISVYTMLDTLMIGFMSSYKEVAFYTSATKISKLCLPIVTALGAVAMPRLAYYMKEKKYLEIQKLISKSFSLVSFLAFPLAIALIIIAPTFIPLYLGSGFEGAIVPLQILSILIILIGLNNLAGIQILVVLGYEKLVFISVLMGSFSNFGLNLMLIPLYGAVGASIASIIAEILVLGATFYFVRKRTSIKFNNISESIKNMGIALLFIPLFYFLSIFMQKWTLLLVFTFLGSLYYLLFQWLLKNPVVNVLVDLLEGKIKNNR